jgi:hypothetical protein
MKKAARYHNWRIKRLDLLQNNCVPPTLNQALDNYAYNGNFYPIEKPWQKMQKQAKGAA